MTNGLAGLAAFLLAFGTLVAATGIYIVAVVTDYALDVPAHVVGGALGATGLLSFLGWAVIETSVFPELVGLVGGLVGLIVLLPIAVGAATLHVVRAPTATDTLRYAVGSWGPSAASFIAVLAIIASLQVTPTPFVYVIATIVMVLVSGVVTVFSFDRLSP